MHIVHCIVKGERERGSAVYNHVVLKQIHCLCDILIAAILVLLTDAIMPVLFCLLKCLGITNPTWFRKYQKQCTTVGSYFRCHLSTALSM